eukprot:TRINITY_DN198_c0_g1_i11.p1 TRINITY_DN198_c0_g1~~TRINITY_DN198_c0_g1_i11.p1  ORF type:complete len:1626 (-),score=281.10 TRINITY_DN198_c0_g1_i11:41-4918(-)
MTSGWCFVAFLLSVAHVSAWDKCIEEGKACRPAVNATQSTFFLQFATSSQLVDEVKADEICYGRLSAVAADEGDGIGDKIETLSLEECRRSCSNNNKCQSFAFCPHFEGCWMKEKAFTGIEATKDMFDCRTYYRKPCNDPVPPAPVPTPSPAGNFRPLSWADAYSRAEAMLARMSSAEKYSMMKGVEACWTTSFKNVWPCYVGNTPAISRLGIPSLNMWDAGNGFSTKSYYDELVGTVTCWPSQLALGASWDRSLVAEVASAIAHEFLGKGSNVLLGPSINVHRVARNGRNFEYLSGEDPYLGSQLVRAYLGGVHSNSGIIAVVKHAFLNHQHVNLANGVVSMSVEDKTLWELYYPPWKAAVDAGVGSLMCAYNKIDGIYSCSNAQRLRADLKGTMGFHGFVMSDWWATHDTSVEEGLDMLQPGRLQDDLFSPEALASLRSSAIDEAVTRILASMYRHDLFSHAWCKPQSSDCANMLRKNVATSAHASLARKAATESIVLLQNRDGVLPISRGRVKTLAVLGKAAAAAARPKGAAWNVGDYYAGGGSGHLTAGKVITPLEGIRSRAGALGITVVSDTSGSTGAADKAKEADLAIVVGATTCGEGMDRPHLHLDDDVDSLIAAVAATGTPTVVIAQTPGALLMPWRDVVNSIAVMFLGGQETGAAWANVLFGDTVPVGRLPLVMPQSEDDTIKPDYDLSVQYTEGMATSYRKADSTAAFPFGHGLTYTSFEYGRPRNRLCENDWCIDLDIENVGQVAAPEVVQLYLELPKEAGWPTPLLKGFQKTKVLSPGSATAVTFRLTRQDRSYYADLPGASWLEVSKEDCVVHIGASSSDIRQTLQGTEVSSPNEPITSLNFSPVDGGAGRACRGPGGQNLASYYNLMPAESIYACREQCALVEGCTGIEWNPNGRCEVWTTVIRTSVSANGYTCMQTAASSSQSPASTSVGPVMTTTGSSQTTSMNAGICYGNLSAVAVDEGGGIGDKIDTLSLEECQRACTNDNQCQSAAYCPHFEGCWLKDKILVGSEPTRDFYDCKTIYKSSCDSPDTVATPPPAPPPAPLPAPLPIPSQQGTFHEIDGGTGRACRGSNSTDNSDTYYLLRTGVPSSNDCKRYCRSTPACTGLEYSMTGRCEIWTRQIMTTAATVAGYSCWRFDRTSEGQLLSLSGMDLRDKIEGYFVGQCVGNFMGLPFELEYKGEMMPSEPHTYYDRSNAGDLRLRADWVMDRVSELGGAFADDDTDLEFAFLHGVEEFGIDMTYSELATVWKRYINDYIWVSNREARNLMEQGLEPPATGMPENNKYWWAIDPQLVNEIWSAFYPGMLEKAVAKAEWSARVTSYDWGLHPTMFYAALYSAAFFVSEVEKLYDIAASFVPADSPYLEGLEDIRAWHAAFSDWRTAWTRVTAKYSSQLFIDGVSAMINGLCGALAFLYGEGDFKKTMGIAIAAGFDNDNQAATLGGLLGVMHGSGKIPRDLTHEFRGHRWEMPFNNKYINDRRDSLPYENKISDIVDRIMSISREAIISQGGYESQNGFALQVNVSPFLLPGVAAPTLQTPTVDTSRVWLSNGMGCYQVQNRESCCMSIDGRDAQWHGGQDCIPSKPGSTFDGGWICEPADHVQATGQQSQADTCTA